MKQKYQDFAFKWSLYLVRFYYSGKKKNKKVYGDFCSATDMKIPKWKQKKVVRGALIHPNGEKVSYFLV